MTSGSIRERRLLLAAWTFGRCYGYKRASERGAPLRGLYVEILEGIKKRAGFDEEISTDQETLLTSNCSGIGEATRN